MRTKRSRSFPQAFQSLVALLRCGSPASRPTLPNPQLNTQLAVGNVASVTSFQIGLMKANLSLANDCRAGWRERAISPAELIGNLQRVTYPCAPGMSIVRR